jgi:hypothetical protein
VCKNGLKKNALIIKQKKPREDYIYNLKIVSGMRTKENSSRTRISLVEISKGKLWITQMFCVKMSLSNFKSK